MPANPKLPDPKTDSRARAKELVELGDACYRKRECDEAIEYYTEAIRLDPKCAKAYFGLGWTYYSKGDYDSSIADCTEFIRLGPAHTYTKKGEYARTIVARAYYNRGNAYWENGDRDRAESDFAEANRLGYKP